ncbi:MAG: hypothetical protein JSW70_02875 [Syntrophobacterales bacterium]|nr:MAG: hypothetical protein JSW70_02875 [Syntrophobacterales bacterium]
MESRRQCMKVTMKGLAGLGLFFGSPFSDFRCFWARDNKVVLSRRHGFPLRGVAEDVKEREKYGRRAR